MKKAIISISAVVLVAIIVISVYFIFIKDKTEQVYNPDTELTPTVAPTPIVTPTEVPQSEEPLEQAALYPVYQMVGDTIKYGYIDASGSFVLELNYDYAYDFYEGVAIVIVGDNYQVIDSTGAVIFENNNTIKAFHNGAASFIQTSEDTMLYGYINLEGQVIIEPKYTYANDFNEDNQAYVALPDQKTYELIDKTGTVIKSYEIEISNGYVYDYKDGYVMYYNYDTMRYGVLSVTGETIFEPTHSDISYLGKDLFAVKDPLLESYEVMTKPAAIFNAKGEQLTDYTMYDIQVFQGDYSSASDENTIFFMGGDGQVITSLPSYEGGGVLTLLGDIVKAEIDGDLIYYRKDNTILWKNDVSTYLPLGITVKKIKFKPLRTVLVNYPQVEGLADGKIQQQINEKLEELFTESRTNITEEDNLSVDDSFAVQLINNLLIVSMTGYDYYEGAAHGMPLQEYSFIDITTGEFYDLKDLFTQNSDYKTKIDEIINKQITELLASEESMIFEGAFTGITDAQHFYLREDGITLYFYPYHIAAYAAGFPEFEISFVELTDYINTEGAFWKAFHK